MADVGLVPELTGKRLLKIAEAAKFLSLSRSKIYLLMNAGDLESVKIGGARRISVASLEKFVANYDGNGAVSAA